MNALLLKVLEAHGGLKRWNSLHKVEATIATDGAFWEMKKLTRKRGPCHVTVWLHRERSVLGPSGTSDLHSEFTPDRVAILKGNGEVIAERDDPRRSFAGHVKATWWDPLQLAYFEGYALWTYLTTPFLLAQAGVEVTELDPWTESGETWRVLRANFPAAIATHSVAQEFFFGADLRLRRHDHRLDIAGGFGATQLVSDYAEVDGLRLPTRCQAYAYGRGRHVDRHPLLVSVEISDVRFT